MRLSHFFIDRPIFALVLAVFTTLMGVFAYPQLPLAQYPEIAPPTIAVSASYPGATAEDVAAQVAAPLEQEINGVEGMLYMASQSTADGRAAVTVTFEPGTDIDTAQVLVQNRVNRALTRLPDTVSQTGVTVQAQATGFLMLFALRSVDGSLDADYLGNYASSELRDRMLRLDGVGDVRIFGAGSYSMRVCDRCRQCASGPEYPGGRRYSRPTALRRRTAGEFPAASPGAWTSDRAGGICRCRRASRRRWCRDPAE